MLLVLVWGVKKIDNWLFFVWEMVLLCVVNKWEIMLDKRVVVCIVKVVGWLLWSCLYFWFKGWMGDCVVGWMLVLMMDEVKKNVVEINYEEFEFFVENYKVV